MDNGNEFPYKKGEENCTWFGAIQRKVYNLSTVENHVKEEGGGSHRARGREGRERGRKEKREDRKEGKRGREGRKEDREEGRGGASVQKKLLG